MIQYKNSSFHYLQCIHPSGSIKAIGASGRLTAILLVLVVTSCGTLVNKTEPSLRRKNYPHLSTAKETFDLFTPNFTQSTLTAPDGKLTYIQSDSNSYYENSESQRTIKSFAKSTEGKVISGVDYSENPVIGVYKEFSAGGCLLWKGLYCVYGFKIGQWYYYTRPGRVNVINYDAGYNFNETQVFKFCSKHRIPLTTEAGYTTSIFKIRRPGSAFWVIRYADIVNRRWVTISLRGADGYMLHKTYTVFQAE